MVSLARTSHYNNNIKKSDEKESSGKEINFKKNKDKKKIKR